MTRTKIILFLILSLFMSLDSVSAEQNRPSPSALNIKLHKRNLKQRDGITKVADNVECYLLDRTIYLYFHDNEGQANINISSLSGISFTDSQSTMQAIVFTIPNLDEDMYLSIVTDLNVEYIGIIP